METDKAIEKLKKTRAYRDPDNRAYVADLEREFERIKTDAAFQKLDQVKMIRSRLKSVITSASLRLVEEDDPEARRKIKADKEAFVWLLRFFSRNVEREMAEINEKVNELL